MHWILLLAIVGHGYGPANSQQNVRFATKAACLSAGDEWIRKVASSASIRVDVAALCVPDGAQ